MLISIRIVCVSYYIQCTDELHLYFLVSYVLEFWISKYLANVNDWYLWRTEPIVTFYKIKCLYFFVRCLSLLFIALHFRLGLTGLCTILYSLSRTLLQKIEYPRCWLRWILKVTLLSPNFLLSLKLESKLSDFIDKNYQLFFHVYLLNETIKIDLRFTSYKIFSIAYYDLTVNLKTIFF